MNYTHKLALFALAFLGSLPGIAMEPKKSKRGGITKGTRLLTRGKIQSLARMKATASAARELAILSSDDSQGALFNLAELSASQASLPEMDYAILAPQTEQVSPLLPTSYSAPQLMEIAPSASSITDASSPVSTNPSSPSSASTSETNYLQKEEGELDDEPEAIEPGLIIQVRPNDDQIFHHPLLVELDRPVNQEQFSLGNSILFYNYMPDICKITAHKAGFVAQGDGRVMRFDTIFSAPQSLPINMNPTTLDVTDSLISIVDWDGLAIYDNRNGDHIKVLKDAHMYALISDELILSAQEVDGHCVIHYMNPCTGDILFTIDTGAPSIERLIKLSDKLALSYCKENGEIKVWDIANAQCIQAITNLSDITIQYSAGAYVIFQKGDHLYRLNLNTKEVSRLSDTILEDECIQLIGIDAQTLVTLARSTHNEIIVRLFNLETESVHIKTVSGLASGASACYNEQAKTIIIVDGNGKLFYLPVIPATYFYERILSGQ